MWAAPLLLAAAAAAGCGGSALRVTSYQDPYFPETYQIRLVDPAYRIDPTGDIHLAARAHADVEPATTQYLLLHIFWRPHPGKTYAESSATDALVRYVVSNSNGTVVYSGTAFAYPEKPWTGGLKVSVESARLRLESRYGDIPDVLGEARLAGTVVAHERAGVVADIARSAELLAGGEVRELAAPAPERP